MNKIVEQTLRIDGAKTDLREIADTMVYVKDGLFGNEEPTQSNTFWHFIHAITSVADKLEDVATEIRDLKQKELYDEIASFDGEVDC